MKPQDSKASSLPFIFTNTSAALKEVFAKTDWTQSSIGLPHSWPAELQMLTNVILAADTPMFLAWGEDRTLIYNQALVPLLGAQHPAALGQPLTKVWPEDWGQGGLWLQQVQSGETVSFTNRPSLIRRNGHEEQAWFTSSLSPVFSKDGSVSGIFCTVRETTVEVLAEQARSNEIRQLREIFDNAPGMLVVLRGPDHVFEVANKTYRDFIGKQNIIGKKVCDVLPELSEQGYLDLLDTVYRKGEPYQAQAMPVKLKSPIDGTEEEFFFDFIYQPIKGYDGSIIGIFAEGIDVTATFTAAVALRESERRYRALTKVAPMLVWVSRNDCTLAYCNQRWYDYTGLQPNQTWEHGWDRIIHPNYQRQFIQTWETAKAHGRQWHLNVPLRQGADGGFRWHLLQAQPVLDDTGVISEWIGVAIDLQSIDSEARQVGGLKPITPVNLH